MARQQPHHWEITTQLLRIFFPDTCRETDGWTRARVKARVNLYRRQVQRIQTRPGPAEYQEISGSLRVARAVAVRSRAMEGLIDYIDAVLTERRTKRATQPPPDTIDLGILGLVLK